MIYLRSKIYHLKSKRGFTLLEILIVVTLLIILAVALLVLFNPKAQFDKAKDAKRKTDLSTLSKTFEDWYNDRNCYPRPSEVCYPSAEAGYNPTSDNKCYLCGKASGSPDVKPYLNEMVCDPLHPTQKYLYQVDGDSCPQSYWIYADLSYTADDIIVQSDCGGACGPAGNCSYNFGFASPNANLSSCNPSAPTETPAPTPTAGAPTLTPTPGGPTPTSTPTPTPSPTPDPGNPCSSYASLYIIEQSICNICGSYAQCKIDHPGQAYFTDPGGGGDPGCTIQCYPD